MASPAEGMIFLPNRKKMIKNVSTITVPMEEPKFLKELILVNISCIICLILTKMDKKENIESITGLMRDLMHSTEAHTPHAWLHLELTREQLRVIFLLFFKGSASPGEVAESFGVPKANVTSVIDRLVGKGLVNRQENQDDRRSYILSLTEEGRSQVKQLREIGDAKIKRVLERMSDEALASLQMGLESLSTALKEEGESHGYH